MSVKGMRDLMLSVRDYVNEGGAERMRALENWRKSLKAITSGHFNLLEIKASSLVPPSMSLSLADCSVALYRKGFWEMLFSDLEKHGMVMV